MNQRRNTSAAVSAVSVTNSERGVRVPLWTMRFAGVAGADGVASKNVLVDGDRLEVFGVDAQPVLAEMVKGEPRWDRADEQLVGDSMCEVAFTVEPEMAVGSASAALPDPAIVNPFDLSQETLDGVLPDAADNALTERVAVLLPASVMRFAEVFVDPRLVASFDSAGAAAAQRQHRVAVSFPPLVMVAAPAAGEVFSVASGDFTATHAHERQVTTGNRE